MSKIRVRNRLWPTDTIPKATIEFYGRQQPTARLGIPSLDPGEFLKQQPWLIGGCILRPPQLKLSSLPVASFQTDAHGVAVVTKGLPDGAYLCTVTPKDSSSDAVGPATASDLKPPKGIYRMVSFDVHVRAGTVTLKMPLNSPNGTATPRANEIVVELQPVWMRSPAHGHRAKTPISLIVVHHTACDTHTALSEFMHPSKSAHYLIDTDGQIVKLVQDPLRAFHAGFSHWAGKSDINFSSIGIEIVNNKEPYPEAQYTSLIELIQRLLTAYRIPVRNIVGHSDIGTQDGGGTKLGRKSSDPGLKFEWIRLESKGWGLLPGSGVAAAIYGGFFDSIKDGVLQHGDNDAKQRFGRAHRPKLKIAPVAELQDDLTTIGYSLDSAEGEYDDETTSAVHIFQEHFFAGGRGHKKPDGKLDELTARMVKGVRMTGQAT
jgi:N-acetylmuramoyl-L-alanine amidase